MLRIFRLFIIFAILPLLIACNPTIPAPPTPPMSLFVIQITVTDMSGTPLPNAQVIVSGSGFDTSSAQFTDNLGVAIVELNTNRVSAIALVRVTRDSYQPYSQHVNLNQTQIPLTIRLQKDNPIPNTLTPTSTLSPEPIAPSYTPEAVATNTPIPTETPTETATHTPTSTPTNTPTPTSPVSPDTTNPLIRVIESQVILYAGPSAQNVNLFIARSEDELIPFERTRDNNWLRVRKNGTNIEGWTPNDGTITWLQGSVENVPFSPVFTGSTYPIDTDGSNTGDFPSNPSDCNMTIRWENRLDHMRIYWSNQPLNTRWLRLTMTDAADAEKFLEYPNNIDANDSDTETRGYSIAFTQFGDRGFPAGTTFKIVISALDQDSNTLCTRQTTYTR